MRVFPGHSCALFDLLLASWLASPKQSGTITAAVDVSVSGTVL